MTVLRTDPGVLPPARPDTPGNIVLVVDDSPGTLGMLSTALEYAGYKVLLAQPGAAALALIERVTPTS